MLTKILIPLLFVATVLASVCVAEDEQNTRQTTSPSAATSALSYPQIILYSVSWCPKCREAKAYLTQKNIPFLNRDVEADDAAMDTLLNTYKTTRVPLIVIGDDEAVLQGFNAQNFEKALHGLMKP